MTTYSEFIFKKNQSIDYSHFLTNFLRILEVEKNSNPSHLMASVQKGFPFSVFEALQKEIDIPQKQLSDILGIPTRTISRRKEGKHFTSVESDRIYRIVRVLSYTVDVLGDIEKARAWLKYPNIELGGKVPIQLLDTDIGVGLVEDVLNRIKYGIYA